MVYEEDDWDQLPCCDNCRFYRGPVPVERYVHDHDDKKNTPWFCMHPDNAEEGFLCPCEDCVVFQPNTFGCVLDKSVRTHYWIHEGPEGLGLNDSDDKWPF